MGRRKSMSSTVVPRKKAPKLETTITCPFCDHAGRVKCSIDRKLRIAEAACRVCEATYATASHALIEPIDVYGQWIDECDRANDAVDAMDCT